MPRVREYAEPPPAPAPSGPPRRGLRGEWRAGLQVARLVAATPTLRRAPRGDGAPVVLIPGWKAPPASMVPLRNYLGHLGHDARDGIEDHLSNGNSTIVAPGGGVLAGPLVGAEGYVTATLDLDLIAAGRMFDPTGHYARPDVFTLTVGAPDA